MMIVSRHGSPWSSILALLILSISAFVNSHFISPRSIWDDPDRLETSVESRDAGTAMRILCLGASVTFGVGSTDGNGYRAKLRTLLVASGNKVHFVGTQSSGNMENNANEGYPGFRIDQVTGFAWNAYGYYPNVVCIHLGTNDFAQGYDPTTSAERMGILVDEIYSVLSSETLVVVSKLLPNENASTEAGIVAFNSLLDGVVSQRSAKGLNVVLVDMHSDEFSLSDLGPDGTHPTDEGYQKMAGVWNDAISSVVSSSGIATLKSTGLSDTDNTNNVHCDFTPSEVSSPSAVNFGFGNKSAIFKPEWINVGIIINDTIRPAKGTTVGKFFARMDQGPADDYLHVDDGNIRLGINFGNGDFWPVGSDTRAVPLPCDVSNIRWGDIDGDGYADFICIDGGQVSVTYTIPPPDGPVWNPGQVDMSLQFAGNIYIGDVDGDGADDIILVSDGGSVSVIYPIHASDSSFPTSWTIPNFNASSTYFVDINGDGRADYVSVANDGSISAWLNYRGPSPLVPNWQPSGIIKLPIANITSKDMRFGHVRTLIKGATKNDLMTLHTDGDIKLWENRGYNGIAWGEYIRYCDMTNSGSDSLVTLGPSGSLKFFQNLHNGGFHLKYGQILGDQGINRKDVRLADMDGDGRCDYVVVNNQTGEVKVSLNQGVTYNGNVSSFIALSSLSDGYTVTNEPPAGCQSSAGILFADLDGDGKSDYICVTSTGGVYIGLNDGGNFDIGTSPTFSAQDDMTSAAGVLGRELISFADINGDGYADYLFFNPTDGSVTTRLNTGKGKSFGSSQTIYSDPSLVGGFLKFANINGLGRADIINVNELSGKAKMSSNRCTPPTPPTGIGPNPNGTDPVGSGPGAYNVEWTAWGDSYASGVGSGAYIEGRRCLRYANAYPIFVRDDPDHLFTGLYIKMNYVACSGAKAEEVTDYQLYNINQSSGQPNWQYYPRPSSGKPSAGTLSVGGDDIDFPGILNNCIIEGFPFPLSSGFTSRTCDEQRALTWSLISENGDHGEPNLELIAKIDSTIKSIVNYVHSRIGGNIFFLYVTGYGQFFNDEDPGCNTVTFARLANPKNDGKSHVLMTTDLRQDFNSMTLTLNAAIKQAVSQNYRSSPNVVVRYIDIDGLMGTGHRFCEPGIQEPDQDNPNLWFFHYPYGTDDTNDPTIQYLNSVEQANANTLTWDQNSTLWVDYLNEFWSQVDETQLNQTVAGSGDVNAQADIWPDIIGYRAKVFHPQVAYHEAIYHAIARQYSSDLGGGGT